MLFHKIEKRNLFAFILIFFLYLICTSSLLAEEGTLKWRFETGEPYYDPETESVGIITSPAIDNEGTIYILNNYGTLYAVDPDGNKKWVFETGDSPEVGGPGFVSPSIGPNGSIYAKGGSGKLYSINKNSQVNWIYYDNITGGADFGYGLPIDSNGAVILPEWNMRAINHDGSEKWIIDEYLYTLTTPAIGPDGTIYTISNSGILRARDSNGVLKWAHNTNSTTFGAGVAVSNDGTILFGSGESLYALTSDGTEKWSFDCGERINNTPVIGYNGIIYVSVGFTLLAIDFDGNELWRFDLVPGNTGDWTQLSTPAIGFDGTIFAASDLTSKLYAINPNGTKKWEYHIGSNIRSSPAIAPDGTILLGGNDGYLYAITSECGGIAPTDWPMYGRDLNHTCRNMISLTCSTGENIGFHVQGGTCSLLNAVDPASIPDSPSKPNNLLFGLFDFQIETDNLGDSVEATFTLPYSISDNYKWYKYSTVNGTWKDYSNFTALNITNDKVTITIVDGGEGDDDGIENRIIIDPSGLFVNSTNPGDPDDPEGSSGGSGGGCFIGTSAYGFKN